MVFSKLKEKENIFIVTNEGRLLRVIGILKKN